MPSEINDKIQYFVKGTNFNTLITTQNDFFFWVENDTNEKQKKVKKRKLNNKNQDRSHHRIHLKTPLTLIQDLIKLNPFSNQ